MIFLMETKKTRKEWDRLKVRLGTKNCLVVDCERRRGGLALLWDDKTDLTIQSFSSSHIDAVIRMDNNKVWRLTGFYGQWDNSRRLESWELLRRLGGQLNLPWLCFGDFNEILFQSEKRGGNRKPNYLMQNFKEALEDCNLFYCGFRGYPFTWANNFETGFIEERLDRFCATPEWHQMFPRSIVHHSTALSSDHCPISIDLEPSLMVRKKKSFRFEAMWVREQGCEQVIKDLWHNTRGNSASEKVSNGVRQCSSDLSEWNRLHFGKVHVEIRKLNKQIQRLERIKDKLGNRALLKVSKERLEELLIREETMW